MVAERFRPPWWLVPLFILSIGCLAPNPWMVGVGALSVLGIVAWLATRIWAERRSRAIRLANTSTKTTDVWPTQCGRCGYSFAKLVEHSRSDVGTCPECGWDVPWAAIADAHKAKHAQSRTPPGPIPNETP